MKRPVSVLTVLCLTGLVAAAQIQPLGQPAKVQLNVIKRVPVDYYLLTGDQPLTFNISTVSDTGNWLRIYTRLLWQNRQEDKATYSILFIKGGQRQRFRLDTERSNKTLGPAGQPLGKWRSFFVKLMPGDSTFKLVLDSAQSDTVAIRLAFETPAFWERLTISGGKGLTVITKQGSETMRRSGYYHINRDEPGEVSFSGPGPVRVRVRLNFDPTMRGEQVFGIAVQEDGKLIAERSFRVKKALGARYEEMSDVVPSVERVLKFDLKPGAHRLKIILQGTTAKGGALMLERLVKETGYGQD